MNKFQQGKIYSIRSHQTDKIYIGSTINRLSRRINQHRSAYKKYLIDKKIYVSSYEILKYTDHFIELLEMCPCSNKNELTRREGELIRSMNCVNKLIPGRNIKEYGKEYYQNNKIKIQEDSKKYKQENKLKIQARGNKKCICYCGCTIIHQNKARHEKSMRHIKYFILM